MKYLTLLVFLGISLLCEAQQDSIVPFEKAYKRTYNIRKVSGVKPTIDGKLDEDFWTKQGEWSDRFVFTALLTVHLFPFCKILFSPSQIAYLHASGCFM